MGRGYPDISAQAVYYLFSSGGSNYNGGGSQAAASLISSMLSLINAARLRAGGSTLGWINPALYGHYQSFTNDITIGINNCASTISSATCCRHGFSAAAGWDPASGLGTLIFVRFRDFMMMTGYVSYAPTPVPTMKPTHTPTAKPSSPSRVPTGKPTTTSPRGTVRRGRGSADPASAISRAGLRSIYGATTQARPPWRPCRS